MIGKQGLQFSAVVPGQVPEDKELKERVELRPTGSCYRHYLARQDGTDVAFMTVCFDSKALILSEIFVPKQHRHRGLGAELLRQAEKLARENKFDKVRLNPKPFERDFAEPKLIEWYQTYGYRNLECSRVLQKVLS
jgi:GNAT superfamily N-acetyltransferase